MVNVMIILLIRRFCWLGMGRRIIRPIGRLRIVLGTGGGRRALRSFRGMARMGPASVAYSLFPPCPKGLVELVYFV